MPCVEHLNMASSELGGRQAKVLAWSTSPFLRRRRKPITRTSVILTTFSGDCKYLGRSASVYLSSAAFNVLRQTALYVALALAATRRC
ncbi:hypothetical protein MRB53_037680 [Persea americana]|nr:hypothetical protein MRB53_037680 [Persea americana]